VCVNLGASISNVNNLPFIYLFIFIGATGRLQKSHTGRHRDYQAASK